MLQRSSIVGAAMLAATLCIGASAGAQDTKDIVDCQVRRARTLAVAADFQEPAPVL